MENLKLYETIATALPTFEYINGIAYEISVNADDIELSLNKSGTLGLQCKKKMKLTTELISSIMDVLEDRLNKEINNNKMSWYYDSK